MKRRVAFLLAVTAALGATPAAQTQTQPEPQSQPQARTRLARPFAVGERATYDIRYLFFPPGTGSMEVVGIDTVRGRHAYRFMFTINASALGFRIRDTLQSWVDTSSFHGLRFNQDQHEGGKDRQRQYELFPERLTYSDRGKPEQPSVADPLDDVSFLYFVRGLDLRVGGRHEFARYFKPESNPVKLNVIRRERIRVPYGEFNTVVVQPVIKAGGLFGEKGKALLWLTDDSSRKIVQVKIDMPIVGTLTLQLKTYQPRLSSPPRKP